MQCYQKKLLTRYSSNLIKRILHHRIGDIHAHVDPLLFKWYGHQRLKEKALIVYKRGFCQNEMQYPQKILHLSIILCHLNSFIKKLLFFKTQSTTTREASLSAYIILQHISGFLPSKTGIYCTHGLYTNLKHLFPSALL